VAPYASTRNGGHASARLSSTIGCGTIFRLAPDGKETVLYAFSGNSDGAEPYGGVVADGSGNLYGTTIAGGGADGLGVVFKLSPRGKETALHAFAGEPDGAWPEAGVVFGPVREKHALSVQAFLGIAFNSLPTHPSFNIAVTRRS